MHFFLLKIARKKLSHEFLKHTFRNVLSNFVIELQKISRLNFECRWSMQFQLLPICRHGIYKAKLKNIILYLIYRYVLWRTDYCFIHNLIKLVADGGETGLHDTFVLLNIHCKLSHLLFKESFGEISHREIFLPFFQVHKI
jgi:hypothetical protein